MLLLRLALFALLLASAGPSAALETSGEQCLKVLRTASLRIDAACPQASALNNYLSKSMQATSLTLPDLNVEWEKFSIGGGVTLRDIMHLAVGTLIGIILAAMFWQRFRRAFSWTARIFRRVKSWLSKLTRRLSGRRGSLEQLVSGHPSRIDTRWIDSEIDDALDPEEASEAYKEEMKVLHLDWRKLRDGLWFHQYDLKKSSRLIPEHQKGRLSPQIAEWYSVLAKQFFSSDVPKNAEGIKPYDEIDGRIIIEKFRESDFQCFYVLDRSRQNINGNFRKLVIALWFISALGALVGLAMGYCLPALMPPVDRLEQDFLTVPNGSTVLIFLICYLWLTWTHHLYKKAQNFNAESLGSYMNSYLSGISDRYREATGIAKQITVGQTGDPKILGKEAARWHRTMVWLPFRTFYIESFYRNVQYQVDRNSDYYRMLFVVLFVVSLVLPWLVFDRLPADWHEWFVILIFILLMLRSRYLTKRFDPLDGLEQHGWQNFQKLDVSQAMDAVVAGYAEEVGWWKARFER